jgi:hypothetical protein
MLVAGRVGVDKREEDVSENLLGEEGREVKLP